jgi:acetylornithine/N-succinyldiaminopimelate aminotransferase
MTAVVTPVSSTSVGTTDEGGRTVNNTGSLLPLYRRAPMEFVRGQGVELIDADGRHYLDFVGGIAVNSLGYNDEGLRGAMLQALESGLIHVSNLYRTSPGEQLADALVSRSFADAVFFCNSGAEANEGAFKFARRWGREIGGPAKTGIVSLRGGFHGRLFTSLAATDRPSYRAPFRPLAGGVTIAERSIDELGPFLESETVCALIVEPIQGEGGVRVLEDSFLRELREITHARNIALIFDEVQCGLGRTGQLFAYENSGVTPDMLTLAKPLAGGLPMGAVLLTSEIASAMQPGDHGTTFGGGPFVASVALHVLNRLSDPELLAHVREDGAWFGGRLNELTESTGKVRGVRGMGYMWGVDVMEPAAEVVKRALDVGLLVCSAGDYTVRLLPPLVATREDLARGLDLLQRALR